MFDFTAKYAIKNEIYYLCGLLSLSDRFDTVTGNRDGGR